MGPVEGLGGQMPILIKPLLFLIAFGPMAVLFASVVGLACLLLMTCVRAIEWLPRIATERPKPNRQVPRRGRQDARTSVSLTVIEGSPARAD
jgi:hypothetical protein